MFSWLMKLVGVLFGALVSWPGVLAVLGASPDFRDAENFGSVIGAILGMVLISVRGLFSSIVNWKVGWLTLLVLMVVGVWLWLNFYLAGQYHTFWEQPIAGKYDAYRFDKAEFAVKMVAILWATPLAALGAFAAERIELALAKK